MPLIDLFAPADLLSTDALREVAERIVEAVHEEEGYTGSAFAKAVSWTYIHEVPASRFGGVTGAPWRVEVASPVGSLTPDAKARLGRLIPDLILRAEGLEPAPLEARRVWVIFRDVADGHWFAGGLAASRDAIAAAVGRERAATSRV